MRHVHHSIVTIKVLCPVDDALSATKLSLLVCRQSCDSLTAMSNFIEQLVLQVADVFNKLFDLKLTTRGLMEYAYRGETLTPSNCGRMDQACAYGSRPVALTYTPKLVRVFEVQLATPLYFVVVDLKADKDTTKILKGLQAAYEPGAHTEVRLSAT